MKIFCLLFLYFPLPLLGQSKVILPTIYSDQTEIYSIELIECTNGNWVGIYNRGFQYFIQETEDSRSLRAYQHESTYFNFDAPSEEFAINLVDNPNGLRRSGAEFQIVHQTDINHDGLLDLIVYVTQSNELSWCERVAPGKYKQPVVLHDLNLSDNYVFDFFVQEEFFIYLSHTTVGSINLNAPLTDFHFKSTKKITSGAIAAIADINQNGTCDFLLDLYPGGLVMIEQGTSPKLKRKEFIRTNVKELSPSYFVDINNDDRLDIMTTGANRLQLYCSNGNGHFDGPFDLVDTTLIAAILPKEFDKRMDGFQLLHFDADGDGDNDLLLFGEYLVLLENIGKGNFSPHRIGDTSYDPHSISLIDLENDGDLDIILNSYEGISLFYNDRGRFTESHELKVCGYSDVFFRVDLDMDGDQDFLVADECEQQIYWSEKTQNGYQVPHIFDFLSLKPKR